MDRIIERWNRELSNSLWCHTTHKSESSSVAYEIIGPGSLKLGLAHYKTTLKYFNSERERFSFQNLRRETWADTSRTNYLF